MADDKETGLGVPPADSEEASPEQQVSAAPPRPLDPSSPKDPVQGKAETSSQTSARSDDGAGEERDSITPQDPELRGRRAAIAATVTFTLAALLTLVGLGGFGIWDPWELDRADAARSLLEGAGDSYNLPPLTRQVVALGFDSLGVHEWAGRLPIALFGLGALAIGYLLVASFAGRRAGLYTVVVCATTPLYLLNSRLMLGDAPAIFAQALIIAGGAWAMFFPWASPIAWEAAPYRAAGPYRTPPIDTAETRLPTKWTWLAVSLSLALGGVMLAVHAAGALEGALAPLWAVVGAAVATIPATELLRDRRRLAAIGILGGLAAVLTAAVALAIVADRAEYSLWLGGTPRGGNPPSFENALEVVFHGFAPWGALLPIALGRLLWRPAEGSDSDAPLRLLVALWASIGYGAMTLFGSRYGAGSFLPVVALAAAVALLLRDAERSRGGWWATAVVGTLFTGLLIRDFGLYPTAPTAVLGLEGITAPEVFEPKRAFTVVLGLFAATLLCFGGTRGTSFRWKAPYALLRTQWERGLGFRIWIVLIGLGLIGLLLFGAVAWILSPGDLGLTVLGVKLGRRGSVVVVAVPILLALGQLLLAGLSRLGSYRLVPVLAGGMVFGGYFCLGPVSIGDRTLAGYIPELSSHFSPREVYDAYNRLADPGEPLGEYRVGRRAAAYYATGEIEEFEQASELVEFLRVSDRRWAVFPTDELASLDRAFRTATGRHLFIADARSARVLLGTNHTVEGQQDGNYLADAILAEPPADLDVEANIQFRDAIELVGYDLDLPHDGFVGASESFTVTWYWRVTARVPGSYQVFLHIDGQGNRIHGDHDPVDGKYPVRLWEPGDIVVDRQELDVPANYAPGPYTFFIGFYAGDNRLAVTEGSQDGEDRAIAGVLQIR